MEREIIDAKIIGETIQQLAEWLIRARTLNSSCVLGKERKP
jgi:hypothetical protein